MRSVSCEILKYIYYFKGGNPVFLTVHMTSNLRVYIRSKEEADQFYEDLYGSEVLQVSENNFICQIVKNSLLFKGTACLYNACKQSLNC